MGQLNLTFWGVRGSIPAPGPSTDLFGGNTSCVEVSSGDDVVLLDMGSGLRSYGEKLGRTPARCSIFVSHYHWDHIQGLPFFGPAYNPGSVIDIYGPVREGRDVRSLLSGQMVAPYFPVTLDAFRSKLGFHTITSGQTVQVGKLQVTAHELNHPNGVLAYRIALGDKSVVYATDTEHGTAADDALVELARDAEALVYDCMYTDDEYEGVGKPAKTGWGHSTWTAGLKILERANAKRLVLFHHEPTRSDKDLQALADEARQKSPAALVARERETLTF